MDHPILLTLREGDTTLLSGSVELSTRGLHHLDLTGDTDSLKRAVVTLAVIAGHLDGELEKRARAERRRQAEAAVFSVTGSEQEGGAA